MAIAAPKALKYTQSFYIDGQWQPPCGKDRLDIINPCDEQTTGSLALANDLDVDRAVAAATRAFQTFSRSSIEERIELLQSILSVYERRHDEVAEAISLEMGAPLSFARRGQAACGSGHLKATIASLKNFTFTADTDNTRIVKEPVGVCALITPWNWPVNQIACKVAPALACGCTCVLKPSEVAPLSALLFAHIIDEAGAPAGVFNLINGTGPQAGTTLVSHPGIDMVSFTGSTRGGVEVAKFAAATVKRVTQELGGKSPYLILEDADLETAVIDCCKHLFLNSGQSCNAPSRLLVPAALQQRACAIARDYALARTIGAAFTDGTQLGPVVNQRQYDHIQALIQAGLDEGAKLICGGTGRPDGHRQGYFVKPTVFANVNNQMRIAREEIFGPVLAILPYKTEREAIDIANDTPYGLAAYIYSANIERAREMASQLRVGMVHINGADNDFRFPFGGYKQSGNGREWGKYGFEDYLETKAIMGYYR